jgi:hypothetical protein
MLVCDLFQTSHADFHHLHKFSAKLSKPKVTHLSLFITILFHLHLIHSIPEDVQFFL